MSPSFLSIGGIIIGRQCQIDHQERFVYPTAKAIILQYALPRARARKPDITPQQGAAIIFGDLLVRYKSLMKWAFI